MTEASQHVLRALAELRRGPRVAGPGKSWILRMSSDGDALTSVGETFGVSCAEGLRQKKAFVFLIFCMDGRSFSAKTARFCACNILIFLNYLCYKIRANVAGKPVML